ncbi:MULTISPECIES: hypothetical protein [Chryseobacterium]|uniref:Uncharacterized protein n=1 Tax=Chryseobacterium camelliae TaxID=1265445 RepID=A0ABU0TGJ0_9FLAO|nr:MULTISPECIES: hypothetical protein [Chryseobacterium]MDT3406954.1 hypothetical protein [Pseudacidovorax intermedius]MDQ1095253.1 hypothetical protein [Chryseobacterium camelliae]MDQ1099191.1 hypothetical protein [Chryseobacterium sp. SORGH_AS_1048]MDR6086540.1 hypothetical protein [Chryseobacterium sp. SORGH_AS_0909]MDR6130911.1 hypothetical protein [Chryseobacterium sp. SORGH_AS_1175]
MRKEKNLATVFLLITGCMYGQVGINTTSPKATLDVTAKTTDGTRPEGIIAPKLTGDQIKSADGQYLSDQKGVIVYATAAVNSASAKTANITSEGYYYFDGNLWQKIGVGADTSIYKGSGSLSGNTTVSQNGNTLAFTGTSANAFSVDGSTLSVDAANHRLGLGTSSPSAKFEINNSAIGTPSIKVNSISSQPSNANAAYLTIDNATGEFYKGAQSEKVFYYQKYNLNNVNGDYISNFDTKISTSDYTLIIVGSYFNLFLAVDTGNPNRNRFTPQNVFAFKSNGTWRITADFPSTSSLGDTGTSVGTPNGNWTIYTMIIRNNQVVNNSDATFDLGGSNTSSASASPVP